MAAAAGKKTLDTIFSNSANFELGLFLIGGVVAALVGWLSIKVLLKFLQRYPLNVFAYYRIALGILILITTWILI